MLSTYQCANCNARIEQRTGPHGAAWVDPSDDLGDAATCFGDGEQAHKPHIRVGRDSRDERGGMLDSMVDWTKPAEFDFANEVDGLTTLQELGDELRQIREHEKHVLRYLHVAARTLSRQHHSQPQAIIRESGVARQTIYNMLAGTICSVCEQPIEPHSRTGTEYRHRGGAPVWCNAKPPVPLAVEPETEDDGTSMGSVRTHGVDS